MEPLKQAGYNRTAAAWPAPSASPPALKRTWAGATWSSRATWHNAPLAAPPNPLMHLQMLPSRGLQPGQIPGPSSMMPCTYLTGSGPARPGMPPIPGYILEPRVPLLAPNSMFSSSSHHSSCCFHLEIWSLHLLLQAHTSQPLLSLEGTGSLHKDHKLKWAWQTSSLRFLGFQSGFFLLTDPSTSSMSLHCLILLVSGP